MALFDFFKGGVDVADIQSMLAEALDNQIRDLKVELWDTRADLFGECDSMAVKEKAILLAGNVNGVEKVNAFKLKVLAAAETMAEPAGIPDSFAEGEDPSPVESRFYQIQSGDTLWKIAKEFYGDGNQYQALFEQNREVIKDPDKIYPGQMIRIPEL